MTTNPYAEDRRHYRPGIDLDEEYVDQPGKRKMTHAELIEAWEHFVRTGECDIPVEERPRPEPWVHYFPDDGDDTDWMKWDDLDEEDA